VVTCKRKGKGFNSVFHIPSQLVLLPHSTFSVSISPQHDKKENYEGVSGYSSR
jgi:hypothetical protein